MSTDEDTSRSAWRRARRPGERTSRRDAIKAGARELLAGGRTPAAISIGDVASAAGMSPAGLYTYFASRDAILVALATDELETWLGDLAGRLMDCAAGDVEVVARAVVASLEDRRPLLILMGSLSGLLVAAPDAERAELKGRLQAGLGEVEAGIETVLPTIDGSRVTRMLRALIVGLWSFTTTEPAAPTRQELSWFRAELERAVQAVVYGELAIDDRR